MIKKSRDYNFPIKVELVICNNVEAMEKYLRKKNSIPYFLINTKKRDFENKMINFLKIYKIEIICLAGYMKIISKNFINRFGKKNNQYTPFFTTKV